MNKLKKGKYELQHDRYIDDWGFERDVFEVNFLGDDGVLYRYPFMGDMKVHARDRNFPINRIPHDYNKEDYQQMLDKQIAKIENYDKTNIK